MSDFLTNLVMRSFSGTPAVQPMTFSTYAAPEPALEPFVEEVIPTREVEQKQVKQVPANPVPRADKHETTAPTIEIQTPEPAPRTPLMVKEQFVLTPPVAETKEPPRVISSPMKNPEVRSVEAPPISVVEEREKIVQKTETKTEYKTEIQPAPAPAQLIHRTPIQTVQPAARRLATRQAKPAKQAKQADALSSPPETLKSTPSPALASLSSPTPKTELEIVEQVIERPSVTLQNTQQVTSSFTTLIPNTSAQPLPAFNFKSRAKTPPSDLPIEAEPPTPPTPETVINVAIGRIEVRATPATTPRRERQQNGPKVRTLDDYLQQRSRGTQ